MNNDLFNEVKEKINLITDIGIRCEINAYFDDEETFETYNLKMNGQEHIITVKLIDNNFIQIKSEFMSFINFIQYPGLSCYIREEKKDSIEYSFVTANAELEGFLCRVYFMI